MKKIFSIIVIAQAVASVALAETSNPCGKDSEFTAKDCVIQAAALSTYAGSAGYAVRTIWKANKVEKQQEPIFALSKGPSSRIKDGDRVTIEYTLSEAESREHYANEKMSEALALKKKAEDLDKRADQIAKISKSKAAALRAEAVSTHEQASHLAFQAQDIRKGLRKVSLVTETNVMESDSHMRDKVNEFVEKQINSDRNIVSINRLPFEKAKWLKAAFPRAIGALAAMVVAPVVSIADASAAASAKRLRDQTQYMPSRSDYGSVSDDADKRQ